MGIDVAVKLDFSNYVNFAIDRWADQAITDKARKHGLALDLTRLDELQEVFYQLACLRGRRVVRRPGDKDYPTKMRDAWLAHAENRGASDCQAGDAEGNDAMRPGRCPLTTSMFGTADRLSVDILRAPV